MLLTAAGLLALILTPTSQAHDLKVMASRLAANPGDQETIYLSYGHVLPVDSPLDGETLQDYQLLTPSGSVQVLNREGTSLHANVVQVEEEGLYQAAATRKPSVYSVVADANGNHQHIRKPKNQITEGTIERSARSHQFAKALMVSGANADQAVKPLGHELEIIPVDAPNDWRSGRDLAFRVLFRGKPLASGDLVATYVGFKPDNAWCYATSTDAKGVANVRPSQPGTWIIRVRTQLPAARAHQEEYDVESYGATLVLEVRP